MHGRARELGTTALCWELPHQVDDAVAAGLVEGTLLHAYRFDRYRNHPDDDGALETLLISAHHDVSAAVEIAIVVAEAQNRARDLQNAPGNELTPDAARAPRAGARRRSGRADGRDPRRGATCSRTGWAPSPPSRRAPSRSAQLIDAALRGAETRRGPLLALVGKAVTFDSGGISLKPGAKMSEMKFDMSGGAAVLEAIGAIARLQLPIRVLGIVGATENMPSGRAVKPGDIVRASTGTTIEINNTDAEGRLVLADCLAHAVAQGAERIVDLATLTGAMVIALGHSLRGPDVQRRRVGRRGARGCRAQAASWSGACRCTRTTRR